MLQLSPLSEKFLSFSLDWKHKGFWVFCVCFFKQTMLSAGRQNVPWGTPREWRSFFHPEFTEPCHHLWFLLLQKTRQQGLAVQTCECCQLNVLGKGYFANWSICLQVQTLLSPSQSLSPFPTAISLYFHYSLPQASLCLHKNKQLFQLQAGCCPLGDLQMP